MNHSSKGHTCMHALYYICTCIDEDWLFLDKEIDKLKTVQDFKISAYAADSFCTMNRRNRQKVETLYY